MMCAAKPFIREKPLGTIYIGRADAFNSATSIPGTISPGTWELEFEMIPNTEEFQLEVIYELREKGVVAGDFMENQASVYLLNPPVHREKRWYKGDFHTHTVYSDGKMTRARNIEMAKQQKLDFLSQPTITSLPITGHKMKTLFHFPA